MCGLSLRNLLGCWPALANCLLINIFVAQHSVVATCIHCVLLLTITKKRQWYTIEYHSVSFSTIGPFNTISVRLNGTLSGDLKYHSIQLNGTKNPKYH